MFNLKRWTREWWKDDYDEIRKSMARGHLIPLEYQNNKLLLEATVDHRVIGIEMAQDDKLEISFD